MKSNRPERTRPPVIARINRLLSACSLPCLRRLARPIALAARLGDNQLRRVTHDNLLLAFPELPAQARKDLEKASLYHTACALTETAFLWHRPIDQVLATANEQTVCPEFLQETGPCIIIAPHLGNWEFLNLWLADRLDLMSLYKPARKPELDQYIRQSRSRNGALLHPTTTSGLRGLLKGLRQGRSCMILPDQRPGRDSGQVEAVFFGRQVDSSTLVQQLVRKNECRVYLATALRYLPQHRFDVVVEALSPEQLRQQEPRAANYLNQRMEQLVRRYPEQYQWAYRRFRKEDYGRLHGRG